MSRINVDIPEEVHQQLRTKSAIEGVPIKTLTIKALREQCDDIDPALLKSS